MKLTLLSKGDGYHFPPCYMLDLSGFRILLECPIDLSSLSIFHPLTSDITQTPPDDDDDSITTTNSPNLREQKRRRVEQLLEANDLIRAEPWFKMVTNINLWDLSFIDVILISSPMGMLGLPFLTQHKTFSAKVYASEATARIGELMMRDIVAMHSEFKQFYGPQEPECPHWMNWEHLGLLPTALKEIVMGDNGAKLGGWRPLYSATDVKRSIQKVQTLKYAEEACYNGALVLKAFSSGLEIGASNWTLSCPSKSLAYLSSSIFESSHAMNFDFHSLQGNDVILFSDCSFLNGEIGVSDDASTQAYNTSPSNDLMAIRKENVNEQVLINSLVNDHDIAEENDKLAFICSCAIDSVKQGGSVLIPIGRLGIVLQLLEQISMSIESSEPEVPIFIISSVAEELLAFTNIVPEWLCKQRQENLFSGKALFGHVELIKGKKLYVFPAVHSTDFIGMWREPSIVFAPHWSLRLGPAVHLLRRWCADPNSLLVLEQEVDADLALLPFKPMAMKVLQCSFLSGIKSHKIQPLLELLQPKLVLVPEDLRIHIHTPNPTSYSFIYYIENETLSVPSLRNNCEALLAKDLAFQLQPKVIEKQNMAIARLKGKLVLHHGRNLLVSAEEKISSSTRLLWGSLDSNLVLVALREKGITGSFEHERNSGENSVCVIYIHEPDEALIEIHATQTVISARDGSLSSRIFEAIVGILDAI